MASFFTVLLIGISLSMDAFSLALIYGMFIEKKSDKFVLALIVGIYHFIMPIIGMFFGNIISTISYINLSIVAAIILIWIGLNLIGSNFDNEDKLTISLIGFLMFGLSVSIDSLTVGIGLRAITNNYLVSAVIFSMCSFIFTYTGLKIGNVIGKKIGSYSKIIGGIILIIIAIMMFIK